MGIDLKIDEKAGAVVGHANTLKGRRKMLAQHERGTTLVEVAVAGALLALALASLFALYGTTVKEARAGDAAAIAQQNCIARIDQMRNLTWISVTNPEFIKGLLNTPTSLDNASTISDEEIRVYSAVVPPPAVPETTTLFFSVTKEAAVIGPSAPSSILGERLIRVDVRTDWGPLAARHSRQLSTLISKSGTKTQ